MATESDVKNDFRQCGKFEVTVTGIYGGKRVRNKKALLEVTDGLCAGTGYCKVKFLDGPHAGLTVVCDDNDGQELRVNLEPHGSDGFCINGTEAEIAALGYRADPEDEGFSSDKTAPASLDGLIITYGKFLGE